MISGDDALARLRQVIDRLIRDGRIVARLDNSDHEIFPVAVSAAEGQSLRDWIVREKVARTIEIGLAYGLSALFVCEGLLMNGQQSVRHVPTRKDSRIAVCSYWRRPGFRIWWSIMTKSLKSYCQDC